MSNNQNQGNQKPGDKGKNGEYKGQVGNKVPTDKSPNNKNPKKVDGSSI